MDERQSKANLNEIRVFGLCRSGHHGIISWLLGHFRNEVYFYNNVTGGKVFPDGTIERNDRFYNQGGTSRDCYIFNVEDGDLPSSVEGIKSNRWETRAGESEKIHHVLVLRDPYNFLASRIAMLGYESEIERILPLWKQHAKEFLGRTHHLPPGTIMVSYNSWFSDIEYRRALSARLGLFFDDSTLGLKLVGSSFDAFEQSAGSMRVNERWKYLADDIRYRSFLESDAEIVDLAQEIFGKECIEIQGELKKRKHMGVLQSTWSLEAVATLAAKVETMPDDRSEELKRLQDDSHLDGVALYYRFFRELSLTMKPSLVLDIGTYRGASAAHLAANPRTQVVTIDKLPEARDRVKALHLGNIQAITMESLEYICELEKVVPKWAGIFDVVFLDALHDVDQVYQEYQEIRPFVRDGGLIFFDDTTSTEQMNALWNLIAEPKLELNRLHWSGFGVVRVDYGTQFMSWSDIVGRAILKIVKDKGLRT